MPATTTQPRITTAQFLSAHRKALTAISDLYIAVEEMPILEAADNAMMKRLLAELAEIECNAKRLAGMLNPQ